MPFSSHLYIPRVVFVPLIFMMGCIILSFLSDKFFFDYCPFDFWEQWHKDGLWMNDLNDLCISTSRCQDWVTGCGQEQLRNNKHNYYNLYYACLKYIEFWLITKYILRIFISDEIPKSKCVVWDFRLTFMSQIIWLVHPHSTVMFYNMIKWVIGLDTFNESATSVGSSGNQCS